MEMKDQVDSMVNKFPPPVLHALGDDHLEMTSKIRPNSDHWRFLEAVRVVIWEELPMTIRWPLNARGCDATAF